MKASRRKIEEALWVIGMHGAARALYRATMGRERTSLHESMIDFYRTLLPPGALVFDVGANVGKFSEVFASVGGRVVAVEPNGDCLRHIEISYAGLNIEAIHAAVGPRNGLAVLNLSDERDDLSSLSQEWIGVMEGAHQEYKGLWSKQVTVPVITLDALIDRYGIPAFIKIDVEGFEEFVLDGLSAQPPLLSFEFNAARPDATMRCVDKSVFGPKSLFNFAFGDPTGFELSEWVPRNGLNAVLGRLEKRERHGDVFVKCSESPQQT
ncbi:MAG: FkbM family methyltransferase [Bryobacteraceae bacterium]